MNPVFDYHALAPEIILTATIVVVLVADFFFRDRERFQTSRLATVGVLASLVPILTLAADGTTRTMFGGAYVVDDYALALKGFFLLVAYITLLVSVIVPLAWFAVAWHAFAAGWQRTASGNQPAGAAFFTQTLLSWNAAPPMGATVSAPVSMLMPRPPI